MQRENGWMVEREGRLCALMQYRVISSPCVQPLEMNEIIAPQII